MVLFAVFIASLLGSLHCLAMCGGLASFCAAQGHSSRGSLAYHGGRLGSYAVLGALAGGMGTTLQAVTSSPEQQQIAAIVIGGILMWWGLVAIYSGRSPKFLTKAASSISRHIGAILQRQRLAQVGPTLIGFTTGLLTVFLPCGWLYGFVLIAGATASPFQGAVVMSVFWVGTVPALALLGLGVRHLRPSVIRTLPRLGGLLLLIAGFTSVFARDSLMSVVPKFSPPQVGASALIETPSCH